MKTITGIVALLASLIMSLPAAHAKTLDTIGFDYKSAAISSGAQTKLQELSLDLKHLKDITVTAYVASNAGDPAENQSFATQRVAAVKSFLVQQGVADSAITTQTIPGPASRARLVEVNYGSAPVASTPPPAAARTAPAAAPVAEKVAPPPAPVKKAAPPPSIYPQTTEEYSDLAIPASMKKAASKPAVVTTPPPVAPTPAPAKAIPPPISTPPPAITAASTPPPPVSTPANPVITAKPEKTSGIQEVDISNQPYRGTGDAQSSRWDY